MPKPIENIRTQMCRTLNKASQRLLKTYGHLRNLQAAYKQSS